MDIEERIHQRYEELIFEFEEEIGRPPTKKEELDLYEQAREYVIECAAAYADYLKKKDRGE